MNTESLFRRALLTCALLLAVVRAAPVQSTSTGTIEGRVVNPRTGEYLANARITVAGTGLETLTDSSGQYRLGNVPAGPRTVRAFHTGRDVETAAITVTPGATLRHDFSLGSNIVKLSEFVVASSKEMDGAAIAINEQRFAVFANLRNVGDATNDTQIYGPSTPAHARFRQRTTYGSLWSFGVKGSF